MVIGICGGILSYESTLPVIVIGFGGHGHVVAAALSAAGRKVIGATETAPEHFRDLGQSTGIEVMSDEVMLHRFLPGEVEVALGVGSITPCVGGSPRRRIVECLRARGFVFARVIHPAAWVAPNVQIGEGAQIHAGVIVQPGVSIGAFTILNTRSSVDHDCRIGEFCHLAPGSTLSGDVTIGRGSHLGTGCNVIQGLTIGSDAFVAAGATVVRNVGDGHWVRGVPACRFKEISKCPTQ